MSYETQHETNTAPSRPVKRSEFDGGKHFCLELDEIKPGMQLTERRRLSSDERDVRGDNTSVAEDDAIFAKDTSVVVTHAEGNKIRIAAVFDEGEGVILWGEPKERVLTPDGWIVPPGLIVEEVCALAAGNNAPVEGYYMPHVERSTEELLEAEVPAFVRDTASSRQAGRAAIANLQQPPAYYGR